VQVDIDQCAGSSFRQGAERQAVFDDENRDARASSFEVRLGLGRLSELSENCPKTGCEWCETTKAAPGKTLGFSSLSARPFTLNYWQFASALIHGRDSAGGVRRRGASA
jgi:hypothetical protein